MEKSWNCVFEFLWEPGQKLLSLPVVAYFIDVRMMVTVLRAM